MRTRPRRVEPEVWFRVVHAAADGRRLMAAGASHVRTLIALGDDEGAGRRYIAVAGARLRSVLPAANEVAATPVTWT